MLAEVYECPICGLPKINTAHVIVSSSMPGQHHGFKTLVNYQGDDRAELEELRRRLMARGGALQIKRSDEIEKCMCKKEVSE